jgi:RNA polymerase sigma-70 factor (ECF subfamily)
MTTSTPPVHLESDALLAARGDAGAFDRVYAAHVRAVRSLARRAVPIEDVEDVAQEIFTRAWQKLGTFRGDAAFGTWLRRVAINVITDYYRSNRSRSMRSDITLVLATAGHFNQPPVEMWDVHRALADLPVKQRTLVTLYYVHGYRLREIAKHLGLRGGTAKSRLCLARQSLRARLAGRGSRAPSRNARAAFKTL